jgi:regulator of chromosome condensation
MEELVKFGGDGMIYMTKMKIKQFILYLKLVPMLNCYYATAGTDHNIAITTDRKVYSWGLNSSYQCGQGHDRDLEKPTWVSDGAFRRKRVQYAGCSG